MAVALAAGCSTPFADEDGAVPPAPSAEERRALADQGKLLLTIGDLALGGADVYVVNADGTGLANLTRDGKSGDATWSADGRWIVFSSRRGGGSADLYRMRPDGSDVERLTERPLDARWPAPSPDGTQIAFWTVASALSLDRPLWLLDLESGQTSPVIGPAGGEIAWSPDGSRFATANAVYARDGTLVHPLPGGDLSPGRNVFGDDVAWSPDGELIAFRRGSFGTGTVMRIVAAEGTAESDIAWDGPVNGMAFAPDGSLLVWGIDLVRFDRGGRKRDVIARDAGEPSWSHDGTRIAFRQSRFDGYATWITLGDGDGEDRRRVSPLFDGDVSFGGWQPRP